MLILAYRSLPPDTGLPTDQRWRTVELDEVDFAGLDLTAPQGISAAIRRVNEGKVANVLPFPHDATIYLLDTEAESTDHWTMSLSVEKGS